MSYSNTPPLPTSSKQLGARELRGERLADAAVGVELGDVAPVLVAGEELRVLLGAGRVLPGHRSQGIRIALACAPCPSAIERSSIDTARATARPSRSRSPSSARISTSSPAPRRRRCSSWRAGSPGTAGASSPSSTSAAGRGRPIGSSTGGCGRLAGVDVAPGCWSGRRQPQSLGRVPRATRAGEPIPFDDGAFDVCFAVCVLHHVAPAERARTGRRDAPRLPAGRADRPLRAQPAQPAHPPRGAGLRVRPRRGAALAARGVAAAVRGRASRPARPLHRVLPAGVRRYCEGSSVDSAGCRWARSTRCSRSGPEGPASRPSALATR